MEKPVRALEGNGKAVPETLSVTDQRACRLMILKRVERFAKVGIFLLVAISVIGMVGWAADWVTLQSERTIYTVDCVGGQWAGLVCSGQMNPGSRYRYRALKAHGEVLFWMAGSSEPAGKLENCEIRDGRNWTCGPSNDSDRSITLAMSHGRAVQGTSDDTSDDPRSFRAASKAQWWMLNWGMHWFRAARY